MSSFTFTCPLTMTNLSIIKDDPSKIKIWRNSILFGYPSMKFINFFEVDSKEEYVKLIEKNLNNNKNLEKLFKLYKKNKAIENKRLEDIEKENRLIEFTNSIRYVSGNKNNFMLVKNIEQDKSHIIALRLLEELDTENAFILYNEYKELSGESQEDINDLVEDYILKHRIYGITIDDYLVGCVIVKERKFKIDYPDPNKDEEERINTFYIQEIFISKDHLSKGYGKYLFTYIKSRCPNNLKYISFMTKIDNIAMHKIAENNNLIMQSISSGDEINPCLFIGINENYNPDE
jgi:hypothetical protein